jgi:hypothetical protein
MAHIPGQAGFYSRIGIAFPLPLPFQKKYHYPFFDRDQET